MSDEIKARPDPDDELRQTRGEIIDVAAILIGNRDAAISLVDSIILAATTRCLTHLRGVYTPLMLGPAVDKITNVCAAGVTPASRVYG